jgi:hypothetical protein
MANPNSAAGAMMGAGMAAGLGAAMASGAGPWGAGAAPGAAASPPPPPPPAPPAVALWHLAENGTTRGPFPEADLAAMAAGGQLAPETLVWTEGQEGWKPARDTALSRLFAAAPPPPPAPPATPGQ